MNPMTQDLKQKLLCVGWIFISAINGLAQIVPATDGPKPLTPEEAIQSFQVPPGFRMELVASEPLIEEPSGVCWDEHGNLYVSELHGYNLEGQYDIDALNKTGELDRIVRRIQANDEAKHAADLETFGRIKQLSDTDGDGGMDQATLFASGLPPCFGMVAAREGIIVVCAPDIYYLADLDKDGVADVRERLFTGFRTGVLERRMNAPQWGLDNWIYIGANGQSDAITGPYLKEPVALGRTDFRIKADGTAIEPVLGSTSTFGHTFTAAGDRLTISTGTPGYQVIPLPWRYLTRNPELPIPSTERNAANYQITFPTSKPHPWRTRRYNDPGFSKYYTDHYGKAESIPNGYFTSACTPFIYRDIAFPESYQGHNFSCEPAQNLIHHSVPQWVGPELHLHRGGHKPDPQSVKAWAREQKEIEIPKLPKLGTWRQTGLFQGNDKTVLFEKAFAPETNANTKIEVSSWESKPHYKDGTVIDLGLPENAAIYLHRTLEANEDTTIFASLGSNDAIKCWLNGTLILENNVNRSAAPGQETVTLNLNKGENSFLMKIVNGTNQSGFYFKALASLIPDKVQAVLKVPMEDWNQHQFEIVEEHYQTKQAALSKREFLTSTDTWFHPMNINHGPDGSMYITDFYREIIEDYSAIPRYLQQLYGLTNGMHHGRIWRLTHQDAPKSPPAKMSHLFNAQLATEVGSPYAWRRETARRLLIERNADNVHSALIKHLDPASSPAAAINALYTLKGLQALGAGVLEKALKHTHWSVKRHALRIGDALDHDSPGSRETAEWLSEIVFYGYEPRLLLQIALSLGTYQTDGALNALAYLAENHGDIQWMGTAIGTSVYQREEALLGRLLQNRKANQQLAEMLTAIIATRGDRIQIQKAQASVKFLATSPHRETYIRILEAGLVDAQQTLERFALDAPQPPDEATLKQLESKLPKYLEALTGDANIEQGRELFTEHCAACHQAGGQGNMAGPNLDSEFQRAPETIVRDILFPNETITEGFETIQLEMRRGADVQGLMASESPTSVTLRFPGGQELTFLRNRIDRVRSHKVSMMPAQFGDLLTPKEIANIVAFIRQHRTDPESRE